MEGTLHINILMGPIGYLISILINFKVLLNTIFSRLTQQLKIKGYKKNHIISKLRREYPLYKLINKPTF